MSDFTLDGSDFISNLTNMNQRVQTGLNVIGDATASQMKTYAQTNHPWTDRTHSATDEISTEVKWEGTALDISITHGVDYGIWLETRDAFEGKYKILEEARDSQVNSFKEMIQAMRL